MNRAEAALLIAPFYDALNLPATKNIAALIESATGPDWRSYTFDAVSAGRDEFVNQVIGFGKAVPDLSYDLKEVFVDSDRIIVRSAASGTPAGDFLGVPHSGKRFAIMTIDIHTVQDGKIVKTQHVEDWASAVRQLKGQ